MWTVNRARELAREHADYDQKMSEQRRKPRQPPLLAYLKEYKHQFGYSSKLETGRRRSNFDLRIPQFSKITGLVVSSTILGYASAYAASFASPAIVENLAVTITGAVLPDSVADKTKAGVECAKRIRVYDNEDYYLGVIRPYPLACKEQVPSHRTSQLGKSAIEKLSPAYEVLEGSYYGDGSILGFNLATPFRIAWSAGAHGGSTPLETAQKNATGVGGRLTKWAKVKSVLSLPATATLLYPTKENRDNFIANNLPCMTGLSGSGLGGVLAGDFCGMIFGRSSLGNPSWLEACTVASSAKYLVQVYSNQNTTVDRLSSQVASQKKAWDKTIHRTKVCLQRLRKREIIDPAELETAINDANLLEPPKAKHKGFYNPDNKFSAGVPGLKLSSTQIGNANLADGRLTLNINGKLQRKSAKAFANNLSHLLSKANLQLCYGTNCPDSKQIDYAFQLAEVVGDNLNTLIRFETRHGLLSGPKNGQVTRSVASLNKAVILPLIADAGVRDICLRPIYNLHDPIPSGFSGSNDCAKYTKSMGWVTGFSSNIGIANALQRVDAEVLKGQLLTAGYRITSNEDTNDLIRGVTVGNSVVIAPDKLMQAFAALITDGSSNGHVLYHGQITEQMDLRAHSSNAARKLAKKWLSEPLKRHRTAQSLGNKLTAAKCQLSYAKTGSSDSPVPYMWRDKLVLFHTQCGGKRFLGFGLIGSPDPNVALGRITSTDLINTIWPGFESATKERRQ